MPRYKKIKRTWKRNIKKRAPLAFPLVMISAIIFLLIIIFGTNPHIKKEVKGVKSTPYVSAYEGDLYLNGARFRSVGVNRYNLATTDAPYMGCGSAFTDEELNQTFSELNPMGVTSIRFWLFQSFTKSGTDYSRFDDIITLADRYQIKLIPVFENQWEHCSEGGYKQDAWYQSGYKAPYGNYPISLKTYIQKTVTRYKNTQAIMMWQIMNEAESWETDALYNFAKDLSTTIKARDKNHMVSFGTMGENQPGTNIYRKIHALPSIDILEVHDYKGANVTDPFPYRFADADALKKPIMTGEAGINLDTGITQQDRANAFRDKMNVFFQKGGDVYLIWSYRDTNASASGGWEFVYTDPLSAIIKQILQ